MKKPILKFFAVCIVFPMASILTSYAQQPVISEKENLVGKFRKLTGADNVNLGINVSFEEVKDDLLATVDGDTELNTAQKQVLRKSASESYDRLDKELKIFLNDREKITKISETAVFQVYDQAFSEAELKELISFYTTAAGQKALQFLPTLSAQVQKSFQSMLIPKVQEFITPKIKVETDLLKQQIKESKTKKP
jgi:hypothetical protein